MSTKPERANPWIYTGGKLWVWPALLLVLAVPYVSTNLLAASDDFNRSSINLNGTWEFRRDDMPSNEWKKVTVPSSFQSHEGTNFHGVGWYRRTIAPGKLEEGQRLLLHFQAAATETEVWWDGQRVGSHLGGWTPFRIDLTDVVRRNRGAQHELLVRLDEKVGHNTQGFLPIIAPHFGGIWQDVLLWIVPETYIDDLGLLAVGDSASAELRLELPVTGSGSNDVKELSIRYRLRGASNWEAVRTATECSAGLVRARVPVPAPRIWSPAAPDLYEVQVALPGPQGDHVLARAAFRSIAAFGPELRLNNQPLNVRGILNWGYSAPLLEPSPGEKVWRSELEFARTNGFNLMKFCLWVPPKRYLELADELGVLTWMEYPTWHPNFTPKFLEPLRKEFKEFFQYDRNHPSVILRSLTCETGPSAELKVISDLYDTAHRMIPSALVEDDSSWIGWNRVHDFYDDHPYGNNHTWPKTLAGFGEYILAHGIKPLVLGESIAADTWVDRQAALSVHGAARPWWAPAALDDMARWTDRMRAIAGSSGLEELRPDSLRYGMLMRKYQIETFRREMPYGGYVITVLRDFPKASMGLLDYQGQPKWTPAEWQWHRETLCLLKTENDRRSFSSGEALRAQVFLSHFGSQPLQGAKLRVTLEETNRENDAGSPGTTIESVAKNDLEQNPGTLAKLAELEWTLPQVAAPKQFLVRAVLDSSLGKFVNSWTIWVVPPAQLSDEHVALHTSLSPEIARELFPGCEPFNPAKPKPVVVASHFEPALAQFLESGGRLLLMPDGQRNSFALSSHWFLRGAPYVPAHALWRIVPRDLLVDLQHFDLASQVVPELQQLEAFDPILLLWDTHDLDRVKTHGLAFETRVGKGRLLVSALQHTGQSNSAGKWLLGVLLAHLQADAAVRHFLPDKVWDYAKARLVAEQTNLVERAWKFKPDPANEGLERGWHKSAFSDDDWNNIRIGQWWESQGYEALDGWAWYRLTADIPERWRGRDVFLSFEGVDDIYELYVNGELAAKGGDLATRKDALSEKRSHNITRFLQGKRNVLVAVRVHDWYGAGGIFRPVTLGTLPFNPELDLLK